jgi:hypothetical protein
VGIKEKEWVRFEWGRRLDGRRSVAHAEGWLSYSEDP